MKIFLATPRRTLLNEDMTAVKVQAYKIIIMRRLFKVLSILSYLKVTAVANICPLWLNSGECRNFKQSEKKFPT